MYQIGEPPILPYIALPDTQILPRPTLTIPTADIPSYKPLVVPPSELDPPEGVEKEEEEGQKSEEGGCSNSSG